MPCGDCHARKQDGSFSSLVSVSGVLGKENVKEVTQLPTKRLVDEGIVVLDLKYMKVDADGKVTENVSDILYDTKVDPFMTLLRNSSAPEVVGSYTAKTTEDAFKIMGVDEADKAKLTAILSDNSYMFYGNTTNKKTTGLMVATRALSPSENEFLKSQRIMIGSLENKADNK